MFQFGFWFDSCIIIFFVLFFFLKKILFLFFIYIFLNYRHLNLLYSFLCKKILSKQRKKKSQQQQNLFRVNVTRENFWHKITVLLCNTNFIDWEFYFSFIYCFFLLSLSHSLSPSLYFCLSIFHLQIILSDFFVVLCF